QEGRKRKPGESGVGRVSPAGSGTRSREERGAILLGRIPRVPRRSLLAGQGAFRARAPGESGARVGAILPEERRKGNRRRDQANDRGCAKGNRRRALA